jgi:adenylosuccinate synthase
MSAGSPPAMVASEEAELLPYIKDTAEIMRDALSAGQRILIEGTQGFGLSPIHGEAWPKCTARDTTAAAFLSEAGLSPMDVDEVVLVLRCHPIRVAGDSGPLVGETSWETIRQESGSTFPLDEYTSVTGRLRRVGHFDAELVSKAINANQPTRIVLNHLDYIDCAVRGTAQLTPLAEHFIDRIERSIGRRITDYGTGPATVAQRCIAAESIS